MKEKDHQYISEVVDFYYSTIDSEHPQGNMSAVAEHFGITRAKVNKILITASVIDSPLHQDIMELKSRGYDVDDIAAALGVSVSTIRINLPYEKVIYNGEVKSPGAGYVEEYRKREQVFLSSVVRKKSLLEQEQEERLLYMERTYSPEMIEKRNLLKRQEWQDDSIHLAPVFSREDSKLFKVSPDVRVLHIELDADLSEVKDLAEIKYPSMLSSFFNEVFLEEIKSGSTGEKAEGGIEDPAVYTISRDILVPLDIPLHNLHYVINQAFGFTNSHLHEYTLSEHDLMWITEGSVSKWRKLLGLVFRNPIRDEYLDFWDDDYEGGSPKKWMRSKYTGPEYVQLFEESYGYVQDEIKEMKVSSETMEELRREFYLNPLALNEALPLYEILSEVGPVEYKDIEEYNLYMEESLEDASEYSPQSPLAQPFVYSFAEILKYTYDFGDDWNFVIKAMEDVEYLVNDGRITAEQMKNAIKDVCTLARPVVIAADGLPLVEDVGGIDGFEEFLRGINGQGGGLYEDKKENLSWAKSNGWPGKIGNLKTLL